MAKPFEGEPKHVRGGQVRVGQTRRGFAKTHERWSNQGWPNQEQMRGGQSEAWPKQVRVGKNK